jgi:hypothetical protein
MGQMQHYGLELPHLRTPKSLETRQRLTPKATERTFCCKPQAYVIVACS